MFIKKAHITLCSIFLFSVISYAQTRVTSIIKSKENNEVLLGATVKNLSTNQSTVANEKGEFVLEVKDVKEILEVSYYGYETLKVKASEVSRILYLTAKLESLNQVIISASRTKEKKHDVPVAISVVTKKSLKEIQANDISEVLNQKPGVFVADLGNEQHMTAIRQPITTRSVFLYLEDGLPIRPVGIFNHNALLETNNNALQNIEIIRGAYSSLYGSEAIGGAINYITEKPSKELSLDVAARANNIGFRRFDAKVSGTVGKTGIYVSSYRSLIEDGFREYGDFEKSAVTAKITHEFSEKFHLEGALTYVDYFSESSGSIRQAAFDAKNFSSVHSFTFRDAEALRASLTADYQWNDQSQTLVKVFYRDNTLAQNPSFRISNGIANGTTVKDGELNENSFESFGTLIQHNVKVSDKFKFSIGGVVDVTDNTFFAEELNVTRATNGVFTDFERLGTFISNYQVDITNIGGFFTGEYKITDAFRVNGGLRLDAFVYEFVNNNEITEEGFNAPNTVEYYNAVTPRLGLVYNEGKYGAYTNYSRGFIPPSVGELFRRPEVPILDPPTFDNFEVGAFGSFLNGLLYADVAVYYLRGKDEIVSVGVIDEQGIDDTLNRNTGGTQHYGIEHKIELKPTQELTVLNNGSISRHEFRSFNLGISRGNVQDFSDNDIPVAPSYLNNLQVIYKPNFAKGLRIAPEWQAVGKYYTDNANTVEYGGYHLLNVRTSYQFSKYHVWANFMNVFDENYATRVSTRGPNSTTFNVGNPFNLTIGVRYSF